MSALAVPDHHAVGRCLRPMWHNELDANSAMSVKVLCVPRNSCCGRDLLEHKAARLDVDLCPENRRQWIAPGADESMRTPLPVGSPQKGSLSQRTPTLLLRVLTGCCELRPQTSGLQLCLVPKRRDCSDCGASTPTPDTWVFAPGAEVQM